MMHRPLHRPLPPRVPLALAFYNGREHGTWLDRLIAAHDRGATAGPLSHAELAFDFASPSPAPPPAPSPAPLHAPSPGEATLCFSSSWRDGGARFKRIRLAEGGAKLTPAPRSRWPKWTFVPIPASAAQAASVRAWCAAHVGGRYDLPGVLAFKLPLVRHRLNWWFCSEICAAALAHAGLLAGVAPHRLSPNALFRLARRQFRPGEVGVMPARAISAALS